MKELSLMATLSSQLEPWNMIMLLVKVTEEALLLVDLKIMPNYLMKLLGLLRKILTQILFEVSIEIDIISLNHSTNQI